MAVYDMTSSLFRYDIKPMEKTLFAIILCTCSASVFAGIRLPYICHYHNWHTLIVRGAGHAVRFYCVLPDKGYISTKELEQTFCKNENPALINKHSGKQASLFEVLKAVESLLDAGYTGASILLPRPDRYNPNLTKRDLCTDLSIIH